MTKNNDPPKYPYLPPDFTSTGYQFQRTASGAPITDIYELLFHISETLDLEVPSPSQWPSLITYMIRSLEYCSKDHTGLESALDEICRRITRRLNNGKW
jgi:hypothetical protein